MGGHPGVKCSESSGDECQILIRSGERSGRVFSLPSQAPTAINADFRLRPLGNYETKMVARTDKHPILTILRKIGDWEQSDLEQ